MHRGLFIAIIIVALMVWLAFRVRKTNQILSVALFTASTVFSLLIVGAFTGLIGG
jgi:hypothetical protein